MPQQDPGGGEERPGDPGLPSKPTGPPPPPGGGPGSGPPPGISTLSGGGLNPQVLRLLAGFNNNQLPIMLKRRGLGPQPGLTPGPPGRGDTVPAMLSPGEMVMNTGVTQDPGTLAMLAQLNQQGAQNMPPQVQGYEHGGMVPGAYCPHCGMPHGQTQGFAFGGMAVPQGAFSGPSMAGGTPQAAAPGFGGGGWGPGAGMLNRLQRPTPQGAPGGPGGAFGPGGYTYNPEGGITNVDPNNPWGTYTGNRDPSFSGQGARNLGGYGQAGYFDPRGNQMLLNSALEGAQGTASALQRQQMTQADLGGLDPAQRAVAKLQALRDTGRGVQDIMANTRAGVMGNANDFAQQLYLQQLQGSLGQIGQTNGARLADWAAGNQANREHKNQWSTLAGGVLGSGLGGYLGGMGKAGGAQVRGSGAGAGPSTYGPGSPYDPTYWG